MLSFCGLCTWIQLERNILVFILFIRIALFQLFIVSNPVSWGSSKKTRKCLMSSWGDDTDHLLFQFVCSCLMCLLLWRIVYKTKTGMDKLYSLLSLAI